MNAKESGRKRRYEKSKQSKKKYRFINFIIQQYTLFKGILLSADRILEAIIKASGYVN